MLKACVLVVLLIGLVTVDAGCGGPYFKEACKDEIDAYKLVENSGSVCPELTGWADCVLGDQGGCSAQITNIYNTYFSKKLSDGGCDPCEHCQ